MALSLNKPKLDNLAGEIWKSAERLRGKFKAYEYQNVILPIIVIRRLECVLIKWREDKTRRGAGQATQAHREGTREAGQGTRTQSAAVARSPTRPTGRSARSTRKTTRCSKRTSATTSTASRRTLTTSSSTSTTAPPSADGEEQPARPDPEPIQGTRTRPGQALALEMGYIYEELLRRFSEQSGEEAGEHFTPREVIRLMVELLEIPIPDRHLSIYDPACGTGGMLSVAKEHLLDRAATPAEKRANVEKFVTVHGQELSPTNYAICQADLLIKNDQQAKVHPRQLAHPARPAQQGARRPVGRSPSIRFDFML